MPTANPFLLLDDPQEWSAFSRLIDAGAGLWESQVVVGGMVYVDDYHEFDACRRAVGGYG